MNPLAACGLAHVLPSASPEGEPPDRPHQLETSTSKAAASTPLPARPVRGRLRLLLRRPAATTQLCASLRAIAKDVMFAVRE